jgi:hypothetical protein
LILYEYFTECLTRDCAHLMLIRLGKG